MAFWNKLLHRESEASLVPPAPEQEPLERVSPLSVQGLEPQFGPPPMAPPEPVHHLTASLPDAELRVISAKLDTIKALLEVVNQRLDRLEGKKSEELAKWR